MKKLILFFLILLGFVSALFALNRQGVFNKTQIPTPQPYQNFPTPSPTPNPSPSPNLPAEINLAVPFTSQAPKMVWDSDHEEFCEEAASLMAASYAKGQNIPNADFADSQLYAIKNWELSTFGYFQDTTAAETARIIKDYFGVANVLVVNDPTLEQIKQDLSQGKVIIEPAAGQQLGNPNFTGVGPLYHNLVIKGYTKDGRIITNDPGTRKGADYIYDTDVLMNAMHDWNGGDVVHGAKVIIVVG